jgi:hypothetical protein
VVKKKVDSDTQSAYLIVFRGLCTPSRTTGADENDFMQIANHMSHLEALTEAQTERIGTLTELVDRLQRENASLKQSM